MQLLSISSRLNFFSVDGRSTEDARAAFERQAAKNWETSLSLWARQMRPGARLVVVLPLVPGDPSSGMAALMDHANAVLQEMVEEATITAGERGRSSPHPHHILQTEPLDRVVFGAVAGQLLFVAIAACLAPAWYASRLDPMRALRTE